MTIFILQKELYDQQQQADICENLYEHLTEQGAAGST